jgi:geranylgeranyl pyrophosphate synthase
MVLGQELDLASQRSTATWEQWREINRLKTGRLFESACVMGAHSVSASEDQVKDLRNYARSFGMAFQLKDDLSDDALTVKLLGADRVKTLLKESVEAAMQASSTMKSQSLFLAAQQLTL